MILYTTQNYITRKERDGDGTSKPNTITPLIEKKEKRKVNKVNSG